MTGSGRIELWGCGFNQFNQIDETGNDVFGPKLITSIPCCSNTESVVFHWAGWADLCCNLPSSHSPLYVSRSTIIPWLMGLIC